LQRIFQVAHRIGECQPSLGGPDSRNFDESKEVTNELPGIGSNEIGQIREAVPSDRNQPWIVLGPSQSLCAIGKELCSTQGYIQQDIGVKEGLHLECPPYFRRSADVRGSSPVSGTNSKRPAHFSVNEILWGSPGRGMERTSSSTNADTLFSR